MHEIELLALVQGRVAVFLQLRKPPGQVWLLRAVLSLQDSHFRPRGGQSDGQLLQNSKVCVDEVMTAHSVRHLPMRRFTLSVVVLFYSDGEFSPPTFTCKTTGAPLQQSYTLLLRAPL